MAEGKFRIRLIEDALEEKKEEERQEALREKYHLEPEGDETLVVVEKTHVLEDLAKAVLAVLLAALASVGLLCLLYPETRQALWEVFGTIAGELGACF